MSTTFKYGTNCSPSRTRSNITVKTSQPWEEETDGTDCCDPDQLFQCPYDKNHQIRACRFPYHLIKCRKNHPKLASELKTCPFNARHLMPKHELSNHIANCVDKRSVNTEDLGNAEMQSKWQVPVSTWTNPNTDEDWDKEADDDAAAPFVWGMSTLLSHIPEPSTTNNLTLGLRAPRTLPWAVYKQ